MTLLTFNSKYVLTSAVQVQTSSSALSDDNVSQTFNLDAPKTVLVIYQANNLPGTYLHTSGVHNAIRVDGADVAHSWDSPKAIGSCARNAVVWLGTLGVGSHTIKGRLAAAKNGQVVRINNRILLIYIFDGDEFNYVDSGSKSTRTSSTLADDPYASITRTPSASCKALILYNVSNDGASEYAIGKKVAINVGGSDYSQAEKAAYTVDYLDSVFTCHALSLSAVSTTVKGRFAANYNGQTVTIDRRQLAVLFLADSTLLDIITSDTQVSTTSTALINDTQATINRNISTTRELLVVAMGTKRYPVQDSNYGFAYGINRGGDRAVSRGSAGQAWPNSAATAWAEQLAPGSQTVQGRFASNSGGQTAKVSSRRVIALWFSLPASDAEVSLKGIVVIRSQSFEELKCFFHVGQDSAKLYAKFEAQATASLLADFEVAQWEDLNGIFIVRQTATKDLYARFEAQATAALYAKFEAQATADLYGKFEAQAVRNLYAKFEAQVTADLYAKFETQAIKNLYAKFEAQVTASLKVILTVRNASSAALKGVFAVGHTATKDLYARFEAQATAALYAKFEAQATADLYGKFETQAVRNLYAKFEAQATAALKGIFIIQHSSSVGLKGTLIAKHTTTSQLKGILIVRHYSAIQLAAEVFVTRPGSNDLMAIFATSTVNASSNLKNILYVRPGTLMGEGFRIRGWMRTAIRVGDVEATIRKTGIGRLRGD